MSPNSNAPRVGLRLVVPFFTLSFFFTQNAAAISCGKNLLPVRVPSFHVRISDLDLTAPEVVYNPPAPEEIDKDVVQRVLGRRVSPLTNSGANRRVFAWTSASGQSFVAKIYRRHVEPSIIAAKMQRELLVQAYLSRIGVRTVPVLMMRPEGIVLQRNVGMVVSDFIKHNDDRHEQLRPHLNRFGRLFAKSPIQEFESFLRVQYPNHGHHDVDRTLENIGLTIADDNVELEMVDW